MPKESQLLQNLLILGFTKILVGLGNTPKGASDSFEVVDLSTTSSVCKSFPDFVRPSYASAGGLIHQDYPLICGGNPSNNECFSFKNGCWQAAASMAEDRTYAAAAPSPFPQNPFSLVIIGGNTNTSIYFMDEVWTENIPDLDLPEIHLHCVVKINSTAVMVIGGYHSNIRAKRTFLLGLRKTYIHENDSP